MADVDERNLSPVSNANSTKKVEVASEAGPLSSTRSSQSRRSGQSTNRAARPNVPNSSKSPVSMDTWKGDQMPNPFKMPNDKDIFALRDAERRKKREARAKQSKLKVYEKLPEITSLKFRQAANLPAQSSSEEEEDPDPRKQPIAVKEDPEFVINVTRSRNTEKETLSEYITKKRDMFLLQYSLGVKRGEMRKLEEITTAEDKKLETAEQYLEEDAAMFDEFLKENDKNSVEAIRVAEEEGKVKLAKVAEMKRLNTNLLQIKSEINKYIDQLKEYRMYKEFLDRLLPDEVRAQQEEKREARRQERERLQQEQQMEREKTDVTQKSQATTRQKGKGPASVDSDVESVRIDNAMKMFHNDEDDAGELLFSDAQQVLTLFMELEESNLSLIQKCQETEEQVEEMKHSLEATEQKLKRETRNLEEQINKLNKYINNEREKTADFQLRSKFFSHGDLKAEEQEKILAQIHKKVDEVYRTCIVDTGEASMSTLDMLTSIESRIEELFVTIEMLPEDRVDAAEKDKEKERRLQQKEEKKEQFRLHQEERIRKAIERAKEPPKYQTGRRLITRSQPPQMKKKDDGLLDKQTREEEEMAYYFT